MFCFKMTEAVLAMHLILSKHAAFCRIKFIKFGSNKGNEISCWAKSKLSEIIITFQFSHLSPGLHIQICQPCTAVVYIVMMFKKLAISIDCLFECIQRCGNCILLFKSFFLCIFVNAVLISIFFLVRSKYVNSM